VAGISGTRSFDSAAASSFSATPPGLASDSNDVGGRRKARRAGGNVVSPYRSAGRDWVGRGRSVEWFRAEITWQVGGGPMGTIRSSFTPFDLFGGTLAEAQFPRSSWPVGQNGTGVVGICCTAVVTGNGLDGYANVILVLPKGTQWELPSVCLGASFGPKGVSPL